MCGIAGIIALKDGGRKFLDKIQEAADCLSLRGPDASGIFKEERVALGHRRLSVIDTRPEANQPMTDDTGRYVIIYNGEFFNFKQHRDELIRKGIHLKTNSDTEVLLCWYILEKEKCLERVNGFFALAIYDKAEKEIFISRDRIGIKPFVYYADENVFMFASEMKALMKMGIEREIDEVALFTYLQLNYIPAPECIFRNVKKLLPGTWMKINLASGKTEQGRYYSVPVYEKNPFKGSYEEAKAKLSERLDASVERRMISDVPLGSFLSGGIDSSVITALAAKHTNNLKTFSIGFSDEPAFDETGFARLVAEKYKTDHTVFSLSTDDMFDNLFKVLDYIDEPFGDSSALAVHILSMQTRKHVTVALSGDGGDELFAGYNKYRAEWVVRNRKFFVYALRIASPFFSVAKGSRHSKWMNRMRQLNRFAEGAALSSAERYWRWCSFGTETEAGNLMLHSKANTPAYSYLKKKLTENISGVNGLNDVLSSDMHLVLLNDMLHKVDAMSMANSLEVRVPFLDYTVVDFVSSLPSEFKIDSQRQKKILVDTFRGRLPAALLNRKKQGFEIPLQKWFAGGLKNLIVNDLLNNDFIEEQKIFNPSEIKKMLSRLYSNQPGEIHARTWGLMVFQYWWKKNMNHN